MKITLGGDGPGWTGEDLRAARKRLGLSQQAIAKLLGMSREGYGLHERDGRAINSRTRMAVMYLLNGGDIDEYKHLKVDIRRAQSVIIEQDDRLVRYRLV